VVTAGLIDVVKIINRLYLSLGLNEIKDITL